MFEYTLKRSRRRKTVAIKVHQQAVTVYAPIGVAKKELESWLLSKTDWINVQITKQSQQLDTRQYPLKSHRVVVFDDVVQLTFAVSNRSHWLLVKNQPVTTLQLSISGRVKHQQLMYQTLLETFLHEQLESYIEMRVNDYCLKMAEALPSSIRIQLITTWGSCNRRRELTFNLLLVSAPQYIIDYVIVHELAHLKHLNHSAPFGYA